MHDTSLLDEDTRNSFWSRVRRFAVPPTMIETATARRALGDWGGACAAAGCDPEFELRAVSRTYGAELAGRLRADLRQLAPDLLRWHLPRTAPDGLLRPGLTLALARYPRDGDAAPLHLVARTAPGHAAAAQRIALALWDADARPPGRARSRPDPRFRLDLHRHLWDARHAPELADRIADLTDSQFAEAAWEFEAGLLRAADGLPAGTPVAVRLAHRRYLLLGAPSDAPSRVPRIPPGHPVLPDAATWAPPDLLLLRTGQLGPDALHPLVAAALVPGHRPVRDRRSEPPDGGAVLTVQCRGVPHRIAVVDGVLVPLDHDPEQLRREEALVEFGGPPLPCLRAIDRAHRQPEDLDSIRQRLLHGDRAGALAAVRRLIGPDAVLRDGALAEALDDDTRRRLAGSLPAIGLGPHHNRFHAVPVPYTPRPHGRTHRQRLRPARPLRHPWRH
ncbi:hypothetical protein AB0O31_09225 [Kitasatospora cineracea]|uniref:hypothetical protein n=1 Tax=Kitasatospora cineracea TaxID=88074 RepID=UPI003444CE77